MDRAHEAVHNAKFVVQNFRQRRKAIGRATGIRNDPVLRRIVNVIIDAHAKRRVRTFCWRGNEDAFRTGFAQMQLSLVAAREKAGRLEHNVDLQFLPRQVRRVALFQDCNLVPAHDDVFLVIADLAVEFPVDRVPFEQVGKRFCVGEIVDCAHSLHLFLRHGAEHVAPDPAEAIDCVVSHRKKVKALNR